MPSTINVTSELMDIKLRPDKIFKEFDVYYHFYSVHYIHQSHSDQKGNKSLASCKGRVTGYAAGVSLC